MQALFAVYDNPAAGVQEGEKTPQQAPMRTSSQELESKTNEDSNARSTSTGPVEGVNLAEEPMTVMAEDVK